MDGAVDAYYAGCSSGSFGQRMSEKSFFAKNDGEIPNL